MEGIRISSVEKPLSLIILGVVTLTLIAFFIILVGYFTNSKLTNGLFMTIFKISALFQAKLHEFISGEVMVDAMVSGASSGIIGGD